MCLGIPMKIQRIDGFTAHCEARGVNREVSLFMLQHEQVSVGDFVVVNLGYATQKLTQDEAHAAWAVYDEMLSAGAFGPAD